jgi:hypothetical protein
MFGRQTRNFNIKIFVCDILTHFRLMMFVGENSYVKQTKDGKFITNWELAKVLKSLILF